MAPSTRYVLAELARRLLTYVLQRRPGGIHARQVHQRRPRLGRPQGRHQLSRRRRACRPTDRRVPGRRRRALPRQGRRLARRGAGKHRQTGHCGPRPRAARGDRRLTPPSTPAGRLGALIRRQREVSELSMRQLADLAGISNPYLSQIENGLRAPSEAVVDALARGLRLDRDELFEAAGLTEEPPDSAIIDAIRADSRLTGRQQRVLIDVYEALLAQGP